MSLSKDGYVYVLGSKNCGSIKIGGSNYPPIKRIKEINTSEPYKNFGPWELIDFRQVENWRKVEYQLHYAFRGQLNNAIGNQKELFNISAKQALDSLNAIDEKEIISKPKVDRMFNDKDFLTYLQKLFGFSGLYHWLDYQGAWTLVLFPNTNGGRYFTLNIGAHEVAFTTLNKRDRPNVHMLVVDELILDFPDTVDWIYQSRGVVEEVPYVRALPRAVSVYFEGGFEVMTEFLRLPGVRRALIAYWQEALLELKERSTISVYARHHNYNAVAKLVAEKERRL